MNSIVWIIVLFPATDIVGRTLGSRRAVSSSWWSLELPGSSVRGGGEGRIDSNIFTEYEGEFAEFPTKKLT